MYDKQAIYNLLNERKIPYECMEHDAVFTMEEMDAAGITKKGIVCKNLFLRNAKGNMHYLVTVPEEKNVDLKALADMIGSTRLSFASSERLEKYLCLKQGSVSPLGILNDESESVVVVFDKELQWCKEVGVHPNDNTATIWLTFADLKKIIDTHGNDILFITLGK